MHLGYIRNFYIVLEKNALMQCIKSWMERRDFNLVAQFSHLPRERPVPSQSGWIGYTLSKKK